MLATTAAFGVLAGVGYLLSEDIQKNKLEKSILKKDMNDDDPIITENEKPSGPTIYQNRRAEEVQFDLLTKATDGVKDAYKGGYLYRDWPRTTWKKKHYEKSDKLVQLEEDISNKYKFTTTTKYPSTDIGLNDADKSVKGRELQGLYNWQTQNSFNKRRNNMPNPKFQEIDRTRELDTPIYGHQYDSYNQGYSRNYDMVSKQQMMDFQKNPWSQAKKIKVWQNGHNNMEPFLGKKGSVNNVDPQKNHNLLQVYTGQKWDIDHKKPVRRFFPESAMMDPWAVGGMPVVSNREEERYIPSIYHNNTKPFEEQRVAPGLNQNPLFKGSTIGFHDPWRPTGNGIFKDINELRVNPKLTYRGRIAGENYFIPYGGQKTAPTISRKPYKDLSFTNFNERKRKRQQSPFKKGEKRGKGGKEEFTNRISLREWENEQKVREMLPVLAEVDKQQINDQHTIILKPVERDTTEFAYGQRMPGPVDVSRAANRNQTYFFDVARETVKEQTEDNIHSHINKNDEDRRHTTYFFDVARETIKEQTEDNIHSHINKNDEDRRHTTYFFDVAKETIREQTEDNIHSHINKNDEDRRHTTYFFDKAKETIREQTEENIHARINPGVTKYMLHDISAFLNASINGLKEWAIAINRMPTSEGYKVPPNKSNIGEYNIFRKQQFKTRPYVDKIDPHQHQKNASKEMTGIQTQFYPTYDKDPIQQAQRIDPILVSQFKKNPYTQSLETYNVPYNPAFPVVRSQDYVTRENSTEHSYPKLQKTTRCS